MPDSAQELSAHVIVDAGLLDDVVDAAHAVGMGEALFEFDTDGLRVAVQDPAQVMLCRQRVDSSAFDHYEIGTPFKFGVSTSKVDDLLGVAENDSLFEFDLDSERRTFVVRFDDVEYHLSGIDPDSVNSTVDVFPDRESSDYDYTVDANVPVAALDRATNVVGLAEFGDNIAYYRMAGSDGKFEIGGDGDTDKSKVHLSDTAGFEWRTEPPEQSALSKISNEYFELVPPRFDTDAVRVHTGDGLPVFFEGERSDGRIDSLFCIAPRVDSSA